MALPESATPDPRRHGRGSIQGFYDKPCDKLKSQLPLPVLSILERHRTCVAAACGAVLGGVSRFADHGFDVDLFVYGLEQNDSAQVLLQTKALIETDFADQYDVSRSPAAVTFTKKDSDGASRDRPFQVVLGMHRARSQIH